MRDDVRRDWRGMLVGVQTAEFPWSELLSKLDCFEGVSSETRDALLSLKSAKSVATTRFGNELAALIDVGLLTPLQDPQRVRLTEVGNRVGIAVRSAMRSPVLFDDSRALLRSYVQQNFSSEIRDALLWDEPYSYGDHAGTLADRACDPAWIERAIAEETPETQKRFRRRTKDLLPPAVRSRLALIVEKFRSMHGPVPLAQLRTMVGEISPDDFDVLLQTAILNLVLFPSIDPDTERMVVGLAPKIHAIFSREPVAAPTVIEMELQQVPAHAVLDLGIVLVAVAGGTVRVRANDHRLYKRDADDLAAELTEFDTLGNQLIETMTVDRVHDAIALGRTLELMEHAAGPDGRSRLVATAEGRAWLAMAHHARTTLLLEQVRPEPDATYNFGPVWESVIGGLGYSLSFGVDRALLVRSCEEELARIPREGAVRLRQFIMHSAFERNPFRNQIPGRDTSGIWRGHTGSGPPQDESEKLWAKVLLGTIAKALWPWGGLRIGSVPTTAGNTAGNDEELVVGLTAIGAYLLGLDDAPPVQETNRQTRARIIVQPTFEITFLDPDPEVESELASFCQRLGGGLGVLFRITRDSVSRAASAGATIDSMMETLQRISAKPIPANVDVEVRSWHARQRIVTLDRPWILRCDDAETADRVLGEAPRLLERLSETVLALRGDTRPETVAKALAAHGITVDVTKAPAVVTKTAKRRRRRSRY